MPRPINNRLCKINDELNSIIVTLSKAQNAHKIVILMTVDITISMARRASLLPLKV